MTQTKPKYANFPERELKVVIGPNINATTTKALSRLSIGSYEMSFMQQERAVTTSDAARSAANHMARHQGYTVTHEQHRDFVCVLTIAKPEHQFKLWITTPFELTQSGHVIWCKFQETGGEQKVGVSFKLATSFTIDDVTHIIKAAEKNALKLADGEPYTLKGNPPPRFQKKDKTAAPAADATAATAEVPAAEVPADDVPAPAAGDQSAG
jgi:hypothetical protein